MSDEYKSQLEEMQLVTAATEQLLLRQFDDCLNDYGLKGLSKVIFNKILELYKAQNNSELATLKHTDDAGLVEKKLIVGLYDYLIKKGLDRASANAIVQKLLTIISGSEYLNKVSATTLFTSLFNSNSLEDYLGKQKRVVFLDTQILLQLLCVDYQIDVPYSDSLFEAGRILYKQLDESKNYLNLYTTTDYIREVSDNLFEAFNLRRFVNLSYIKDFGPSKNVFYNFYLYLNENENMSFSCYEEYLQDLLNTNDSFPNSYYEFVAKSDFLVTEILNNIGINIKPIDPPGILYDLKREYDFILGNHPKSGIARERDIVCMYYLSDQTNFVSLDTGLVDEPYLITLDTTISKMRKKLVEKYQRSYWYIYPPLKFANRLSLMDLKLDSQRINYDIICMAETNFKASNDTISMLDIMSMFFKKDDIKDRKLPRLLSKIKEEERNDDNFREYSEKNHNNMPIDVVLNEIHKHYRKPDIQSLDAITKLFEIDELSEQISALLKKSCNTILVSNKVDERLFIELDELVKQNSINLN